MKRMPEQEASVTDGDCIKETKRIILGQYNKMKVAVQESRGKKSRHAPPPRRRTVAIARYGDEPTAARRELTATR